MPEMPPSVRTGEAESESTTQTGPVIEASKGAGAFPVEPPQGYELREEIGRGGMGVVYRARDLILDREVAVKLLLGHYGPGSHEARRFQEEAQITGQLQHPGIPAVHQAGTTPSGQPFLAMKLVKGRTLADLLKDRPNPSVDRSRSLAIFEHVCHAVGYAHAHGVIHRDLKPSNIMVGAFDEVQVMDWGLAKVLTGEAQQSPGRTDEADAELTRTAIGTRRDSDVATLTGSVMGTPAFMSPEQAGGENEKIGPRADVFGLGAILCVMLTGQPPYRASSPEAVRLQAIRGQLDEALARLDASEAEPGLVALAKRCLGGLSERPANAAEVADAVARLRAASEERARQAELKRAEAEVRVAEQRKRRQVWYGLAAALLVGAAVSVILAVRARQAEGEAVEQRDQTEKARALAAANAEKAQAAEVARRLELGKTAAAAAKLAAGRGRWQEALRLYETALELGGAEDIDLKLGRCDCFMAMGQLERVFRELNELAERTDPGRFAGLIQLRKAELATWRQSGDDPRDLARQALALGLPPADAAYAQAFLVQTAPEAIRHLQEAMRLDPFHSRGLTWLGTYLLITGRRAEFREVVTQLRLSRPDSVDHLVGEMYLHALDGNRSEVNRLLSRLGETGSAEFVPLFRTFTDIIVAAQREDFFLGGLTPQQVTGYLTEVGKLAPIASRVSGEKNTLEPKLSSMRIFQLPVFQVVAELPPIKDFVTGGPLASLAMFSQPAKMAEIMAAVTQAIPDGTFHLLQGRFLQQAGKLVEAEAVLRQALEHPSWTNHSLAARFELAQVQWRLMTSPQTAGKDRLAWEAKALANVRRLAVSEMLPPDATSWLVAVAATGGDHVLALALAESGLRMKPDHLLLMTWKLDMESRLKSFDRAETTATALVALREGNPAERQSALSALLTLARVYLDVERPADALRWCDRVNERLQRAKGDEANLLTIWDSLGVLYWRMRQLDKSLPIFQRVWAMRRRAKGDSDVETLRSQINLGVNYRDAGRVKEALPLLEQVEREGRTHASLRSARADLMEAYALAGMAAQGAALTRRSLAAARQENPPGSGALAAALAQCGDSLLQLKAWEEAETILRETLAIRTKVAADTWTTFNTQSMLGEALLNQHKHAEAERLLTEGYVGMKQHTATIPVMIRSVRLASAVERLVQLYDALEKKDEAAKWRKELERLKMAQ
jgi:hypothetical protein